MPPTPIQGEPGVVGGLQNKAKPIVNGVGRGAIGRGLKCKKRLNSLGEHVGTLETAPIGWGELPMIPKENFDDGTELWGQPEKPVSLLSSCLNYKSDIVVLSLERYLNMIIALNCLSYF